MSANRIELIRELTGDYNLVINSLVVDQSVVGFVKDESVKAAKTKVQAFLLTAEGVNRLSGEFTDPTLIEIKYTTEDVTDQDFTGANEHKIIFIDKNQK